MKRRVRPSHATIAFGPTWLTSSPKGRNSPAIQQSANVGSGSEAVIGIASGELPESCALRTLALTVLPCATERLVERRASSRPLELKLGGRPKVERTWSC